MKKLVFISSIAAPYQVKFCYALQKYFNARFWFYDHGDRGRASWWRVDLGDKCEILNGLLFRNSGRYLCLGLWKKLAEFNPDIVMLGGFSIPGNYLAYLWARRNNKRIMVFTERSRNKEGKLRKRTFVWKVLRILYKHVDLVMASADDTVPQFRDEFGFGDKVIPGRYAADLDAYFDHPLREAKPAYTYLFANRMTPIYNPIGAIEIFAAIHSKYPGSKLLMNAAGEMDQLCRKKIHSLKIEGAVEFLADIKSWEDLPKAYARADIFFLPANFSNGNFTILEAMASGMGVIVSSRVLGLGKLVKDGENGFNCEPSVQAFVDKIENFIQRPELFRKFAGINRPLVKPLSLDGTAAFFYGVLLDRLGMA